ncbi:polysaccharide deacetylase family protein [Paraflavitalea pollutisoli]|uniref:polysaccharide deacetylase family protein n=1 Tax=Paraflavitalea pollutisoli TaxID=3034143 RepID=UPI0023ED0B11|nr:polysaccharide deacetylase family protein [Paraflavitalea sp. H1-2-19X]
MKTTALQAIARTLYVVAGMSMVLSCQNMPESNVAIAASPAAPKEATATTPAINESNPAPATAPITKPIPVDAASVLAKKEVPILCYHQIRDWRPTDSKTAQNYIVPVENFRNQIKALADSGYHTILPDQLYAYLTTGAALPSKPIMLTFDDTDLDQYTVALPEMNKYGFKGVFFVMTVSIGRPNYMTKAQIKDLADKGHSIGSHTWDHHNVKQYQGQDWVTQIEKPSKTLETITGKPINYFAYPFGLWNPQAIPHLKEKGMIAAFQLAGKRDPQDPLHTIRRIIVPGAWKPNTLNKVIRESF